MNPVYQRQIAKSDKIVFTKTDLVVDTSELNELVEKFKTNFPTASIHANYTTDISLLDASNHETSTVKSNNTYKIVDPALSASNYLQKNCIFDADTIFDTKELRQLLSAHLCVVRAKGFIQTTQGWKLLNYTLTQCVFENCESCNQNEIVIIADKSEPDFIENFDAEIKKSILIN
jgi:G3E family GTPase